MIILRGSGSTTVQAPANRQPDDYRMLRLRMADKTNH